MNFNLLSKVIGAFWVCMLIPVVLCAQEDKVTGKIVKTTEKLNAGAIEVRDKSAAMQNNVQQAGENVKAAVANVKAVISVFEPILRFHLKRKQSSSGSANNQPGVEIVPSDSAISVDPVVTDSVNSSDSLSSALPVQVSYEAMANGLEMVSDNPVYNADGTANLGSQNNSSFGCYLDISQGMVLDDIDASSNTGNVDIIFTATDYYGSAPMYALLTPAYVKNDIFANYYFRGPLYKDANIPVRQWDQVNESEIALTQLTGAQFDKIQDNNQLTAVVKRIPGFREKYESRTKIEGKVFAVKTEMGDRTAYGLMYVTNHYGTTGTNGYLKIKLKVTGFDSDGDGIPDAVNYLQN